MSDMAVPRNSSFDPNTQIITILLADGVTPVLVSLKDIDARNWYNVASCINYGSQMGACLVMFMVVLVLTKDTKRRTPIFILNLLSLDFGFLRALLLTLYFPSPWTKLYPSYTFDAQFIPRGAYATSVAGSVMPLLMTITVNLSLILQAHTVCQNMDKAYRHIITAVSVFVFLLAVGFRFAVTVTNSETILGASLYFSKEWISMGALITETISIWYFTLIFTGKLVYTLYNRHRHGWRQWSGVKILAAMGGCTMIIPCKYSLEDSLSSWVYTNNA
jgi:pheromone alpha factor receptor